MANSIATTIINNISRNKKTCRQNENYAKQDINMDYRNTLLSFLHEGDSSHSKQKRTQRTVDNLNDQSRPVSNVIPTSNLLTELTLKSTATTPTQMNFITTHYISDEGIIKQNLSDSTVTNVVVSSEITKKNNYTTLNENDELVKNEIEESQINVEITKSTPDEWGSLKLYDSLGTAHTINIADLEPIKETNSTNITGDLNSDGKIDQADEALLNKYINGNIKDISNADTNKNGHIDETDLENLKDIFLLNKYDINNDGKIDDMDGAILRNENTHSAALTNMDKTKVDFNNYGVIDANYIETLDNIISSNRILNNFNNIASGIKGDVNNDGKVDFADTYLIAKNGTGEYDIHATLYSLYKSVFWNKEIAKQADIDENGALTYIDLMSIKKATNNYSDIHIFRIKPKQTIFYLDKSCSEISYTYHNSSPFIFLSQVLDETEDAYKIVMQAPANNEKKEYWIKKSSIEKDLTPEIDKLVTEKMGIPIISREHKEQTIIPIEPNVDIPNSSDDQNEKYNYNTKPTMTDTITDSARILQVNPGYQQGDYYKAEGGLILTNLNVDKNINVEPPITFDVYNTKDAMGIVEYYDENGNFIRADRIAPNDVVIKDFDSWGEKTKNLIDSIFNPGDVTITHPSISKHTQIEAPKGTNRIVVTNNKNASIYAQLYKRVDDMFKTFKLYKNLDALFKSYDEFQNNQASDDLIENIKENFVKNIIDNVQKNLMPMARENAFSEDKIKYETITSLLKKFGEEGVKDLALNGLDMQEAFEKAIEYAVKNSGKITLDAVKGMASKACKEILTNNPALVGFESMKLVGNLLDDLSKSITEKQLENSKPIILQIK